VTEGLECAEARELIPELAAGVAAGDERARALGHLSGCAECRRELAGTAEVVDELLLLAPEHEPPAGFERAVLARLTGVAPRRHRPRARLLWAASIVAVAGLAAGAVWWGTTDDRKLASSFRHTLEVAHGHGLSAAPLRNTLEIAHIARKSRGRCPSSSTIFRSAGSSIPEYGISDDCST